MKCLLGLYDVDNGEIFFDEKNMIRIIYQICQILENKLEWFFRGSALFDSMTVLDNIMFPLRMFSSKSESDMISRAKKL